MKRIFLFILVLILFSPVNAQIDDGYFQKRKAGYQKGSPFSQRRSWGDDIWSFNASHYRPFGWYVNPGLTYMMGNSAQDDGASYNLTPTGLPGYYLEVGLEHLFKKSNKAVHYFDYGIGIKHFGGQEKTKTVDGTVSRGQFNFGAVFARAAIHNVWQLNKYNFIDQSIGFNIDYTIYGGKPDQQYATVNTMPKLVGQLNYQFGFGVKIRDGFFFVPTVQTPILTLLPFSGFNPGHQWFQSRYQPLIFTLKFAWLFPKKGCPTVDGMDDDQKRSNSYQQR